MSTDTMAAPPASIKPRWYVLDFVERVFLLTTLGWFVSRLATSLVLQPGNVLLMISESLPVLFVLIRKPGPVSARGFAWAIALIGTFTPLVILPNGPALISLPGSGAIMAAGLLLSIAAKVCLNRSFGIVAANRGVKRSGPYRAVRHPMYLGYIVSHAGFLLAHFSAWNIAAYAITWTALILRIGAEEQFLSQDDAYRAYAQHVHYRLIPGLF
jgi:protein-S-isoprenylcysteine O-methyltransferase Ste14